MPPAVRAGSWRDPVLITLAVSTVIVVGRELAVGASIGLATGPAGGGDRLLNSADLLMYEEKQRSRTLTS